MMTHLSDTISAIEPKHKTIKYELDLQMIKQNQLEDTKILLNYFIYAILIDELFKHIFLIIGYGRLMGEKKEIRMK